MRHQNVAWVLKCVLSTVVALNNSSAFLLGCIRVNLGINREYTTTIIVF